MLRALLNNLLVIGVVLALTVAVANSLAVLAAGQSVVHWYVVTSGQAIAGFVGVAMALRLRAKPAAFLGASMTAFAAAKLAIRAAYGIPPAVGAPAQFTVMLAGFLGVVLGAVLAPWGDRLMTPRRQ